MQFYEITHKEIENLSDIQLTKLLDKLLRAEAEKYKMSRVEIYVPEKITRGDGGEDGGIKCSNVNGSIWVTNINTIFQNKAKNLRTSECENEITKTVLGIKYLKKQIKKVLDAGGKYVLFMSYHTGAKQDLDDRIDAFYNACRNLKKKYNRNQFDVFDSKKIADWANRFTHIIIWVQEQNGISRINGLLSIEEWGTYPEIRDFKYFTNSALDKIILGIQEEIKNEKACIRVIGHSGLGKTRLVYESLTMMERAQQTIVYYIVESDNDDIIRFIKSNVGNLSGIIVIDNCTLNLHERITKEIKRTNSSFKLISIDYNVEEEIDYTSRSSKIDTAYFYLNNNLYIDIVKKMLEFIYSGKLTEIQIEEIANYSEGYPIMAKYFAEARIEGYENLGSILGKNIIEKLVFGRDFDKQQMHIEKYRIIKSCSIFSYFGFPFPDLKKTLGEEYYNNNRKQIEFIYSKVCRVEISETIFTEACNYFKLKGILERRGANYSVKPNPLAIKLAIEWWQSFSDHTAYLTELLPQLVNVGLSEQFIERFKYLDELSEAKQIVNEFWGHSGPFGTAEVLNTELGSRLFRSVVEVNPEVCINTLKVLYLDKPKEQLKNVIQGRRNLIWALEKLCFRKETFEYATKIMMCFAVSENENIANNATGQFLHLFQIYLAGTEADLNGRINILEYGINKNDVDFLKLSLQAIGRGLREDQYSRMLGAEKQGSRTLLEDFKPRGSQIIEYWCNLINLLLKIVNNHPSFVVKVKEQIIYSIIPLAKVNHFHVVENFIAILSQKDNDIWYSAIDYLNWILRRDSTIQVEKERVIKLIEILTPVDFEHRLMMIVTNPSFDYEKDIDGKLINRNEEKTKKFAEEVALNPKYIIPYLRIIQEGVQKQGFVFGRIFGDNITDRSEIIYEIILALETVPNEKQNPEFLGGFLFTGSTELKQEVIARLISSNSLYIHTFYLTRIWFSSIQEFYNLFPLIESGKASINYFNHVIYILHNIGTNDLITFCDKLYYYNNLGKNVGFNLLYQFCWKNESKWSECKLTLKKYIINNNYWVDTENFVDIDYQLTEIIEKLLNETNDRNFVITVTEQIFKLLQGERNYSKDHYIQRTSNFLCENYFGEFFNIISTAFLDYSLAYWNVKFLLGSKDSFERSDGVLFRNKERYDQIFEFCLKNRNNGAYAIANMMPLYSQNTNGETVWHEFAIRMLDEFSDDENFLNEFSANMGTFGSVGSVIPFYKMQYDLVNKLLNHKSKKVKEWAKNNIIYLQDTIDRQRIQEEQRFL